MARAPKEASAALRFLSQLTVPDGCMFGKRLKQARYQKSFVREAFAKDTAVGLLSIERGNAETALSAGIALDR